MDAATLITSFVIAMSVPSAITGFCFWMVQRKIDKHQKAQEKKENARKENEVILIECMNAAIALGEATAKAVQRIPDAQCNGDMHAALDYASKIKHKHKNFITEQSIEALYD